MAKKKVKYKQSDHSLIPKHVPLKEKEKKVLLDKYHISERELPKIHKNDAGIKGLNVKSGDVIKILRKSLTAGTTIYYRVVSND